MGWVAPNVPHPIFALWFGLVFWFRLFFSCCWDGERELFVLKPCWDGWDGVGVYVGEANGEACWHAV